MFYHTMYKRIIYVLYELLYAIPDFLFLENVLSYTIQASGLSPVRTSICFSRLSLTENVVSHTLQSYCICQRLVKKPGLIKVISNNNSCKILYLLYG